MAGSWGQEWREIEFRDVAENEGGPIFQFANDASRVERPVWIQYKDIPRAVQEFVGYAQLHTAGYIHRYTPHYYADFGRFPTGKPWLFCTAVNRIDGLAVWDKQAWGTPLGKMAKMRLLYTNLTYDILEDGDPLMKFVPAAGQDNPMGTSYPDEATLARYITRVYRPFTRVITIPRSLCHWTLNAGDVIPPQHFPPGAPNPDPDGPYGPIITEGQGKLESGILLEYIHHLRPDLPINRIGQAMGRLNQYTFDDFPPETLLCEAPEIRPVTSPLGDRIYDITFRFRYMPKVDKDGNVNGQNYFLRFIPRIDKTNLLDYRLITTTGRKTKGGSPAPRLFSTYDFAKLFRPE